MKTITIFLDENDLIEGIKLESWYDDFDKASSATNGDFYQKVRSFGNTARNKNICSECVINLNKDERITGLSYRKSSARVGKSRDYVL